MIPITALYAALLVAILAVLSARIGRIRGQTGVSILDGGNSEVALEMRRHGNFVEHVPLALILMGIVEANAGNAVFLHVVGVALVICRIAHPFGLHQDRMPHPLRMLGAGGTFLLTIALAAVAFWQGIQAL